MGARLSRSCTVSPGNIRWTGILMIGQQFSLDYLIPLALETLRENLFAEGTYYKGDLLQSVLNVAPAFWTANLDYWSALDALISRNFNGLHVSFIKFFCENSGVITVYLIEQQLQ